MNEIHAEQRAKERYKAELTAEDAAAMVVQVQEGRGVFLYRKTKKISAWLVHWPSANRIVPVFYDAKFGQIASVLPKELLGELSAHARNTWPIRRDDPKGALSPTIDSPG